MNRPRNSMKNGATALERERQRLEEADLGTAPWRKWGPYLSERQWGTVREDYSPSGEAWDFFSHDHARSRAYRWGEDGIMGVSDDQGLMCLAVALWNEKDPILKERLFGLTGSEGNHGEDVKEYYYYLDNVPTHSYMKGLYRYPQARFPYGELVAENQQRGRDAPEYELMDTGVFQDDRYFDVVVEYAKADAEDILMRVTVFNHGPEAAAIHVLPTAWFRNTWSWGRDDRRPLIKASDPTVDARCARSEHHSLGERWLAFEGDPALLFTENETNFQRLWGVENRSAFVKDGINERVVNAAEGAVNPQLAGTKVAAHYRLDIPSRGARSVLLRFSPERKEAPFAGANEIFAMRQAEADEFYSARQGQETLSDDEKLVQRQAFAGLLWTKQFFCLDIPQWLQGDPAGPPPPDARRHGRNAQWPHLSNGDVISMPDKWEYPWYAAWDLAFHAVPFAVIDPWFAKHQLLLLLHEWYMHPNGQLPAYEWAFGDVNPPVHAWAAWRVYTIERLMTGHADRAFLERIFHKLMLNFTWWVNRKDSDGNNFFGGGFLGLDNIGVFDRSQPLPSGLELEQSDGTAWMAVYSINMLGIALELAAENPVYEDVAVKFFEHFMSIAQAMSSVGSDGASLWDAEDQFFYDRIKAEDGRSLLLKVRSLVGLLPLVAVEVVDEEVVERLPEFRRRIQQRFRERPEMYDLIASWQEPGVGDRRILSLAGKERLQAILKRMLDPEEFLSDYGIRSLSRHHRDHPFSLEARGAQLTVDYQPSESTSGMFGGNSNWRGPIWFPVNMLIVEALLKYHEYYGDTFKVECPTGSGQHLSLGEVAAELNRRLERVFLLDGNARRPVFADDQRFQGDPRWRDNVPFYEYFHGDNGCGLGASHQTGWTALVAASLEVTALGRAGVALNPRIRVAEQEPVAV